MLGPQAIPARHPVHGRRSRAWSDLAVIAYDFCGGGDDGAWAPHVAEGLIVAKNPLFSTYRQGENRVTSSMLAVFERIDLSLLETMLAAASGESSLEMVSFTNQPPGKGHSVPDALISASFSYLFEVKTSRNAVAATQLTEHLLCFETAELVSAALV
jgi:hypothetical protein